jgi:nucleoside-diphosphate-sugar epimerase
MHRFTFLALLLLAANSTAFNVLVIGGTRFSGAYLWKELYDRGHEVTVYNRGKTAPKPVARESDDAFQARISAATSLQGDRKDHDDLKRLVDPSKYDYVFDMNAREVGDTKPLAELFVGQSNFKQYVFMSSAGVYMKSDEMPHLERDPVDPKSRHKGKLDSENCLKELGLPWCSFRPTYICGPQNYNPVERYFFERVDAGRPVCIPGHGQHLTGKKHLMMASRRLIRFCSVPHLVANVVPAGLGHVEDLAVAMANCIGREGKTNGKVYNVQNTQAVTFDGVAKAAGKVLGKEVEVIHYDPKDFTFPEGKKVRI